MDTAAGLSDVVDFPEGVGAVVGELAGAVVADSPLAVAGSPAEVEVLEEGERGVVGSNMKARQFLKKLRREEIVAAIREAEKKTSGEIRVFISRRPTPDPLKDA